MQIVDLTKKTDTGERAFEMWDGIAVMGKIESYGNAGMIENPKTGIEEKAVLIQISIVVPQCDVSKFIAMEDQNNMVQMLVQPASPKSADPSKQENDKYGL